MGSLSWLFERFDAHADSDAVVWADATTNYRHLHERVTVAQAELRRNGVEPGEIVMLDADFSPASIAMLLAVIDHGLVIVPVAAHVTADRARLASIAQVGRFIRVDEKDQYEFRTFGNEVTHELLQRLRAGGGSGLVLFSSGSTGEPKAALHELEFLLRKYRVERHTQRILTFLLFDHIGGFNTLFYSLSNHGCAITLPARDPETVCRTIARYRAELLPTSPTFLRMMLMSGAHRRHDLSSLKVISYGTEVMPESTLRRLHEDFPDVDLRQSYGLSELGIMRARSRSSDSLWVKVGGEDYETRVVNGQFQIKAKSSMLGYLNAPSPFTADGWFDTQDEVDVDGEWIRFKGRKSNIINVGGEKVYPEEVESVVLEVDNVIDATVSKEAHPFTGNIVVVEVQVRDPEDSKTLAKRIRAHCFSKLPPFKVPVKVRVAEHGRVSERFKKARSENQPIRRD